MAISFEQDDNDDEVIDEEYFDDTLDVGLEPAELSSSEFVVLDGISLLVVVSFFNKIFAI